MQNKGRIWGLFIIVFLGLYLMVLFNTGRENDAVFTTDAFYQGISGSEINYKDLYNSLYVGLAPGSGECSTEMKSAEDYGLSPYMAGRFTWLVAKPVSTSADMGTGTTIMPYEDGDYIIAPGNLKFVNSNIVQDSADFIHIEAILNDTYVIRWDNVTSWWCHLGKEHKSKHSKVVGNGGIYSSCSQGFVIGEANAMTRVTFYKIGLDGEQTLIDVSEVFGTF